MRISGAQDSAQTDLPSERAGLSRPVWRPGTHKAPILMGYLEEVDLASRHTAADFCNRIKEVWFALDLQWPRGRSEGKALEQLFHSLCTNLLAIQVNELAQEAVQTELEAQLVSSSIHLLRSCESECSGFLAYLE